MKNSLLLSIFLFLFIKLPFSQKRKEVALKGKIVQKPWSKSTQSYCTQGSAYFVARTQKNKEYVLENHSKVLLESYTNTVFVEMKHFLKT